MKIHDRADGVKVIGLNGDTNMPVVPVERFERSIEQSQLMSGGEITGNFDLERH